MSYNKIIAEQIERGRAAALALRAAAPHMTDNELIASMRDIPKFNPEKDYSEWNVGAPVKEEVDGEYKVFRLLVPHNAAEHDGIPSTLPEFWAVCVETEIEAEPTWNDQIEAQVTYTAMMTDTLLEV